MITLFESLKINRITFESGDQNVYVNAVVKKESLSYPTDLIVNFTDLNILINKLQENNPDSDISSLFEEEKMYDGGSFYQLNSEKYQNNNFQINHLEFANSVKQIRA